MCGSRDTFAARGAQVVRWFAQSDIDLKPTAEMAANARRGLELREKHGKGGTAVGVARARDISNRANLSPRTVKRMHSFFARHAGNEAGGEDDAGYIAWLLWGGDAGKSWAARKSEQIDKGTNMKNGSGKARMMQFSDPITDARYKLKDAWKRGQMRFLSPETARRYKELATWTLARQDKSMSHADAREVLDYVSEFEAWSAKNKKEKAAIDAINALRMEMNAIERNGWTSSGRIILTPADEKKLKALGVKTKKMMQAFIQKFGVNHWGDEARFSRASRKAAFASANDLKGFWENLLQADGLIRHNKVERAKAMLRQAEAVVRRNQGDPDLEKHGLLQMYHELRGKAGMSRPGAKAAFSQSAAWIAKYLPALNQWWRDRTDHPTDLDASSERWEIEGVLEDVAEHCREAVPREAKPSWYAAALRDVKKLPHSRKANMKASFAIGDKVVEDFSWVHKATGRSVSSGGAVPWRTPSERDEWTQRPFFVLYSPRFNQTYGQMYKTRAEAEAALKRSLSSRPGAKAAFDVNRKADDNAKKRDEAYRRGTEEIHRQIRLLTDYLRTHEAKARKNPGDWGYVGDLGAISRALTNALHQTMTEYARLGAKAAFAKPTLDEVMKVVEDLRRKGLDDVAKTLLESWLRETNGGRNLNSRTGAKAAFNRSGDYEDFNGNRVTVEESGNTIRVRYPDDPKRSTPMTIAEFDAMVRRGAMTRLSRTGAKAAFGTPDEALTVFTTLAEAEKASINGNRAKAKQLLQSIAALIARDRSKLPAGAVAFYEEMKAKVGMSRPGAKSTHAAGDKVSRKIATLTREGYRRDQAVAIAHDMKRRGEI